MQKECHYRLSGPPWPVRSCYCLHSLSITACFITFISSCAQQVYYCYILYGLSGSLDLQGRYYHYCLHSLSLIRAPLTREVNTLACLHILSHLSAVVLGRQLEFTQKPCLFWNQQNFCLKKVFAVFSTRWC